MGDKKLILTMPQENGSEVRINGSEAKWVKGMNGNSFHNVKIDRILTFDSGRLVFDSEQKP